MPYGAAVLREAGGVSDQMETTKKMEDPSECNHSFFICYHGPKVTCHIPTSYRVSISELNQGIGQ